MLTRPRAFALPATLLVVALLTVLIAGFLATAAIERATADAYSRQQRAELLVRGAVEAGIARVVSEIAAEPDHAIGYERVELERADGEKLAMTVPIVARNRAPGPPAQRYLLSVPSPEVSPAGLDPAGMVDLNADDWMGSPITQRERRFAPWVEVLRDPTAPADPRTNPVVGRYAWFIEDETSKLDLSSIGNEDGPGFTFRHSPDGRAPYDFDFGALPLQDFQPLADDTAGQALNREILSFRQSSIMFDPRYLNRASLELQPTVYDDAIKFYGTAFSRSNDLAHTGTRRANLNGIVSDTRDPIVIGQEIANIVSVIQRGLPSFGARFYPGAAPGSGEARIYLRKIAANLRDYIDPDSLPTVLDAAGNVVAGSKPTQSWTAGSEPQAVGKEAIPYLTEHAWRGRVLGWLPSGAAVRYSVSIDHYLEFFNPSTRDFTAPPGTFIRIANRPKWDAGTFSDLQPPDFEMDIAATVFPAGSVTTITTDPEVSYRAAKPEDPDGLVIPATRVVAVTVPDSVRRFTGETDYLLNGERVLALDNRDGNSDAQTHFLWGTGEGFFDSHPALLIAADAGHPFNFDGSHVGARDYYFYASALAASPDGSATGDPRSLSEPLAYTGYSSGGSSQTAFVPTTLDAKPPGDSSFGSAASKLVDPTKWRDSNPAFSDNPDDAAKPTSADTAPMIIRNNAMKSIGELGHIYDPRRIAGGDIRHARGGGRTLPLGRPDDAANGPRFSPEWQQGAWRLADILAAESVPEPAAPATSGGKLNLNSVLRDEGANLRAALRKIEFLPKPAGDYALGGKTLTDDEIDAFVASAADYLETHGPIMERGEISQLSFFTNSASTVGGLALDTLNDRGREELCRRLIELFTTRSASFTVSAVGEVVRQRPDGTLQTLSRQRLATTFLLEPQVGPGLQDAVTSFKVRRVYEHQ